MRTSPASSSVSSILFRTLPKVLHTRFLHKTVQFIDKFITVASFRTISFIMQKMFPSLQFFLVQCTYCFCTLGSSYNCFLLNISFQCDFFLVPYSRLVSYFLFLGMCDTCTNQIFLKELHLQCSFFLIYCFRLHCFTSE